MNTRRRGPALVAVVWILCAAVSSAHAAEGKSKIILLPTDFNVLEWTASGVMETVPDWTSAAESSLTDAARTVLSRHGSFEVVTLPDLSAEEQDALREHLALYKLAAFSATDMLRYGGAAWQDKRTRFDYTLGDGLAFLADRSGADAAVCVAGAQVKSSGGRVAMFVLLAAAGVAIPLGGAQVTAGLVDLKSGDISWMDDATGLKGDVREMEGATKTLDALIGKYPRSRLLGRK